MVASSRCVVYLFVSLIARVLAGSGCNEAVDDPGPWVSQLDIQKTEEGFELALHLVGGDVASSSTESIELLVSETSTSKQQHFVLKKTGKRKGGIMEVRTEESLPSGKLEMKVTLAEVNGNSHGPEVMRCTPQGPNFSCLRVKTVAPTKGPAGQSGHMQHMQGMQGTAGGMAGRMAGGMAGGMAGHRAGQPDKASASQVRPMAALALGELCVPDGRQCAAGTDCKAGVSGFTCQARIFSAVTPGTLTLTQSLRMALIGALVLLLCLCVVGCLYRRRLAESRSFDELPKVMGKTNLDLPRLKTRKYEAFDFDSDEEYRTF